MQGFFKIGQSILSREETIIYKEYYCRLCSNLNLLYGLKSCLLNSYDIVVVMLIVALAENKNLNYYGTKKNPPICSLKHRASLKSYVDDEYGQRFGKMTIVALEGIINDKIQDGDNSFKAIISKLFFYNVIKKAKSRETQLFEEAQKDLSSLGDMERHKSDILTMSKAYGDILYKNVANVFGALEENFECMIKNIGAWMYFMDALIDYDSDIKSDKFNPLKSLGYESLVSLINNNWKMIVTIKEEIVTSIMVNLYKIRNDSIEWNIIMKIIYFCLPENLENALLGKPNNKYFKDKYSIAAKIFY